MWFIFALGSAVFAALTSILAKIGVEGVNSTLATAIRTAVVLLMSWGMITTPILWNQNADTIFLCVIIISIWMSMGSGFLVFMAGLQNLNQEVLEQGRVDGIHGRVQELVYLILPMMKPQLLFGAINAIVGSFGVFDVVVQFAGMPTPNYSAHTIVAHLYDYAFNRFQMGYASAIAVVLFLLTFLLGRLCMRLLRSDDE